MVVPAYFIERKSIVMNGNFHHQRNFTTDTILSYYYGDVFRPNTVIPGQSNFKNVTLSIYCYKY